MRQAALQRRSTDAQAQAGTVLTMIRINKRYFNLAWPAIHRFHLMINSSLGDTVVVETILDVVARCGETRT
jgi:hypothetical protein